MTIEEQYDEFFGTGYWEKQYKEQICIFAKQAIKKQIGSFRDETIVMCEIKYLDHIIELCENEMFEWEHNGKGVPKAENIIQNLKDFNEGRKIAQRDCKKNNGGVKNEH